jgi:ubiquitin fusion degradation protein 1
METLRCFSYACSAVETSTQELLKCSNKILLPPSILHKIDEREDVEYPLFFKLIHPICEFGRVCAVHEFTATEGLVNVPYYIMEDLGIEEGSSVNIEYINPPSGCYLKLRPHSVDFINLSNPKAVLEHIMSNDYPVVTKGETIVINYKDMGKRYRIDVVDAKPSEVIKIINTDIQLEFDTPFDYVEPEPTKQPPVNKLEERTQNVKLAPFKKTKGFVPFSGKGYVLGSK